MHALDRLFRPRSVAIVGASADPGKLTGRPLAYLRRFGFTGALYPVNPRYDSIAGLRCYADLRALPETPEVGIVLLGAERTVEAVRALSEAGAGAAIVLASGFGEAGEEGRARQRALRDAAGAMRLLGPNTIGLVNVTDRIALSASNALQIDALVPGTIGLVSQSGGILGSLLSRAASRGIGFSRLVATGNEADIDVAECIDYLAADEATRVIALYLEGLRDVARFRAAAAKAAAAGKPVVAFKVGRSESGVRSAVSHTGALAGADRVYNALFEQSGIIRAAQFSDLLDMPGALASGQRLAGGRIAIVTSTGGAATLVADSCGLAGLETPPPDAATAARLVALAIPDATLDRNPVDVTLAGLRGEVLRQVIAILLDSDGYDAVVMIVGSSGIGRPDLAAEPMIAARAEGRKPLLAYVSPEAPAIIAHLNRNGVPAFAAPESCAAALAAMRRAGRPPGRPAAPPEPAAGVPIDFPAGPLNEVESKRLFARFGIPSVTEYVAAGGRAAEAAARRIGGRVVVKILSRAVAHKTEVGGVRVGIASEAVAACCAEMQAAATARGLPLEGFVVQEMITGAVEVILGMHRDPQCGPVVLLGLGGVAAEVLDDTVVRLPPLGRDAALAMIGDLRGAALLSGFRGRPRADVDALADAVAAFSRMVGQFGDRLVEAEINPLLVLPAGQGVRAADGVVVTR